MPNSVRQGIRAFAILVPAVRAGGTLLAVAVLLAVLMIICVIWAAVWSGNKERREAALDVLDRLLRWKER